MVMGSGDEVALRFSAASLPKLPEGWTRDYLLIVDGWAKDADANTAFGETVEPLPFHGMSAYPYRSDEHFPDERGLSREISDAACAEVDSAAMKRWFTIGLLLLALNSAYIFAVHPPTVFYMGNVLVHLLLGTLLLGAAVFQLRRTPMLAAFVGAGLVGLYLAVAGNTRDHHWALWIHVALAIAALPLLRQRLFIAAAALGVGSWRVGLLVPARVSRSPSSDP